MFFKCFLLFQEIVDYNKRKTTVDIEVAAMFRTNYFPGFIRIYGVLQLANGYFYFVLERALFTLKSLLNLPTHLLMKVPDYLLITKADGTRVPTLVFLLCIFLEVFVSLKAIHAFDNFHRDIKPDNILVMSDMTVKIGDMGSMKTASIAGMTTTGTGILGSTSAAAATGTGTGTNFTVAAILEIINTLIGTPRYMDTVQFEQGLSRQKVQYSSASDVYAATVSMVEMTTRRTPFPMKDLADLVAAKMTGDLGDLTVDAVYRVIGNEDSLNALYQLIRRLSTRDIASRGTAAEAVRDLEAIILSLGGDPRPSKQLVFIYCI